MINIREYLKENTLLTDGAMGTLYSQLTDSGSLLCEYANRDNPGLIEDIHRQYVEAGAKLIRTNTFAANTGALFCGEAELEEILRSACAIARRAADGKAYVAGDIGPIRTTFHMDEEAVLEQYRRIVSVFLEEGVDAIVFETFPDASYLKELVPYIRSKSDVFLIADFCINKSGYSSSGISAANLLKAAAGLDGLDACGFNCGIGSGHMLSIMEKVRFPKDKYFVCMPNAGYPEQMQNRMVFIDNSAYFAENMDRIHRMGVDIIGGCCGTTPEYIRRLSEKVDRKRYAKVSLPEEAEGKQRTERTVNAFYEKIRSPRKTIAVELDPPYDAKYDKLIECAQALKAAKVDMITMADSPMGRSRVDSVLMSIRLAKETGMNVMPHICCRDKNMIAIRSTLLGAYINDIRNLLIVTGDPVPSVSRASTTGVFDYHSIQLMNFVKEMNQEHFPEDPFYYGGALNPSLGRVDKLAERMKKKMEAGASYFLTQPVYSDTAIDNLKQLKERTGALILCGVMPLVSYRNALFMKNEFIGIEVPDSVVDRYRPDMSKEEAEDVGVALAKEIMERTDAFVDGYYFMLPFNRVSLMQKILK